MTLHHTSKEWLGVQFSPIYALLICLLASMSAPVVAADAIESYGRWSVFVEVEPKPKTCWAATRILHDPKAKQDYFLAVTRYRGKRDPQVSIYSDKRMRKSSAIYLEIAGRSYRMRSDGMGAWPPENSDKRMISELLKVSKAKRPTDRVVFAGQQGFIRVEVRVDGFGAALDLAIQECSRS